MTGGSPLASFLVLEDTGFEHVHEATTASPCLNPALSFLTKSCVGKIRASTDVPSATTAQVEVVIPPSFLETPSTINGINNEAIEQSLASPNNWPKQLPAPCKPLDPKFYDI